MASNEAPTESRGLEPLRIFISYKRAAEPDLSLAS